MTYDQVLPFNNKHVIITKTSGATYDGIIHQVKDVGGGQFILVDAVAIMKSKKSWWHGRGFKKDNRKVWASKVILIEEI